MLPLRDNVPTRRFPVVTVGLIVANVLVWLWELKAPGVTYHVFKDGYYPCTVEGPCRIPVPNVNAIGGGPASQNDRTSLASAPPPPS